MEFELATYRMQDTINVAIPFGSNTKKINHQLTNKTEAK
jgi:hypothetical protein